MHRAVPRPRAARFRRHESRPCRTLTRRAARRRQGPARRRTGGRRGPQAVRPRGERRAAGRRRLHSECRRCRPGRRTALAGHRVHPRPLAPRPGAPLRAAAVRRGAPGGGRCGGGAARPARGGRRAPGRQTGEHPAASGRSSADRLRHLAGHRHHPHHAHPGDDRLHVPRAGPRRGVDGRVRCLLPRRHPLPLSHRPPAVPEHRRHPPAARPGLARRSRPGRAAARTGSAGHTLPARRPRAAPRPRRTARRADPGRRRTAGRGRRRALAAAAVAAPDRGVRGGGARPRGTAPGGRGDPGGRGVPGRRRSDAGPAGGSAAGSTAARERPAAPALRARTGRTGEEVLGRLVAGAAGRPEHPGRPDRALGGARPGQRLGRCRRFARHRDRDGHAHHGELPDSRPDGPGIRGRAYGGLSRRLQEQLHGQVERRDAEAGQLRGLRGPCEGDVHEQGRRQRLPPWAGPKPLALRQRRGHQDPVPGTTVPPRQVFPRQELGRRRGRRSDGRLGLRQGGHAAVPLRVPDADDQPTQGVERRLLVR